MGLQSIIGDSRAPNDSFFGTITAGWTEGLSKVGSEILPNWVSSQAARQSGDTLKKATYVSDASAPRMEGQPIQDSELTPKTGFRKVSDLSIFKMGNFNITGGQLLLMGGVAIGLIFVLKKL